VRISVSERCDSIHIVVILTLIFPSRYLRQLEEQISNNNRSIGHSESAGSSSGGTRNDVGLSAPNQTLLLEDQRWGDISYGRL